MKTITANIPARKIYGNVYPARTETFRKADDGRWQQDCEEFGLGWQPVLEAEVIDSCKSATNWAEIRRAHFPMYGFHA